MLQKFLGNDEYKKYTIIHMLERSTHMSALKDDMLNQLEISNFIYVRLVDELVIDLEKFNLSKSMKIVMTSNEIFLETDGTVSSEIILERYVADSIKYQMFCMAFFQKFKSLNEFALFYSISYPIAHKNLKELNGLLNEKGITLNKKFQVEGVNEIELRLFILELFNRVEQERFDIYTIRDNMFIQQQLQTCEDNQYKKTGKRLTVFQKNKIQHYLSIIEIRIRQQFIIQVFAEPIQVALRMHLTESYSYVRDYYMRFSFNDEQFYQETSALIVFYTTYCSDLNDLSCNRLYPYIESGYQLLFKYLTQEINSVAVFEKEMLQFKKDILTLHTYLSGVSIEHDSFISSLNLSYFEESYPTVFYFCLNHIKRLKNKIPELYRHRKFLMLNYMLVMLNRFPKEIFMDSVNVYVNFTLGDAYNDFVINSMQFFSEMGTVKITSFEEADIILTNSRDFGHVSQKEYVIWLSPPRPVDWGNLAELIVTIREAKLTGKIKKKVV